jgi:cyclic beta-1,2-glucan synthetase
VRAKASARIHLPQRFSSLEHTDTSGDPPLRAELFSVSQLEQHARTLAGWHKLLPTGGRRSDRLLARLSENEVALREAHTLITTALAGGVRITPAAEWFIDNYYLIEEQIRTARRHLPRGYNRELPRLSNAPLTGTPRVYDIALEFISHSHGWVDISSLRAFVASYQIGSTLRLGELWAIPIMLRLALLENLRRVVATVTTGRRDRARAAYWAEQLFEVAATDSARVVVVLAAMVEESPPLTDAFVSELASRLQGHGAALLFPIAWMEQRLGERSQTIDQVFQRVSQNQAESQVSMSNSIGSLRLLGATDWRDFVEAQSAVEQMLRTDPAAVYPAMDFATRDRYRLIVEQIAKRSPKSEVEVASAAIELARGFHGISTERTAHVGYFLIDEGRGVLERATQMRTSLGLFVRRLEQRSRLTAYVGAIGLLTVLGMETLAAAAPIGGMPAYAQAVSLLVLAICASQLAIGIVHFAATLLVRPTILPRLDFSVGIPKQHCTVVAVPTLLTDADEVDGLLESMEVRFLANRDPHLAFALLSDFRDAPQQTIPGDEELLRRAKDGIATLNAKYAAPKTPTPFFLFHRVRLWNEREGVWMGWERKRGKIEQFNETLRGVTGHFQTMVGEVAALQGVQYVIVLDSDTQLPRDTARDLVSTIAHPLNRPLYDEKLGRITRGYSILQPRVATTLESSAGSRFAQLFAGEPGIDPYTRAVSDVYQDLFDEGSFVGKGIYDVTAFQKAIGRRLPENRILSHDLLEGGYARAGMVSDIVLFEDYPSAYAVDVCRRCRWTRGDWQIAPWLRSVVPGFADRRVENPISLLSRWKILDNLRRSLVPPALLALLLFGWAMPGAAGFSTAAVVAILLIPGLLSAVAGLLRRPSELARRGHLDEIGRTTLRQLAREAFALASLPYDAGIALATTLRTAVRVLFTGHKLLEWRTSSDAQRSQRSSILGTYVTMGVVPLCATLSGAGLALRNPSALHAALPVLVLWALAPALAWWLSRPLRLPQPCLTTADRTFLRSVARRTWRYFETFVRAEDHFLPPDNFQEEPPRDVAHRTSPTNIGMSLLANLAAYDFGYLGAGTLLSRTTLTLGTMDKLPRHRGHFYNWYDTISLEPLRPMYVSTVDSGNLAGHLLTLAAGLKELAAQKLFRPETFAGLSDTLEVIVEIAPATSELRATTSRIQSLLRTPPRTLSGSRLLLDELSVAAHDLATGTAAGANRELTFWVAAFATQTRLASEDLLHMAPWTRLTLGGEPAELREPLAQLDEGPTLAETAQLAQAIIAAIDQAGAARGSSGPPSLRAALLLAAERAAARLGEIGELSARCAEFADIDFDFLYHRERHLLSIGYNVVDHRVDASFYDLLASEARLASFVAIAHGKLPQEHWFRLGRQLTMSGGKPALLSWSGSMFEYLMPLLVMPTYERTLLHATYQGVVRRQIEYGGERGVPWGVSESGYNKTDAQLNYQYRAFGVPGLGFKRGLGGDLVIAPYASAMAVMVAPVAATANLRRMAGDGLLGTYGFYEAVDYSPARLPRGKSRVVVRSYMAHHHGMTLLSLAYVLLGRPMQRRFASDPAFRATELLLQERVPATPAVYPHPAEVAAAGDNLAEAVSSLRIFNTPATPAPEVHLLSNGRYHVTITNAGGGYSRWRDLAVSRWHEDPTRDCWGSFCYIRDVTTGEFWSVAHQPTLKPASRYEAIFSPGRAEFRRRDGELETHVEISVSPEDDVELRRVVITNLGRTTRTVELTSFSEVVLTTPAADAAHPAFSNLFVQTELLRPRQAILCTRRPRSAAERPPWLLHLMKVQGTQLGETSYETGRAEFIGRGRTALDPLAMHRPTLGDSQGSVLDPVVAIRNVLVIKPDETVCIHLVTGIAETREEALRLVEKFSDHHSADRVFELSWAHSQVLLQQIEASESDVQLYERLASNILYANPTLRAPRSIIARNRSGQSALWAYSISGDLPIVLLRIADRENLGLVRQLVKAHAYWRLKGLVTDLLIWNEDLSGYRQVLQEEIMSVIGLQQSEASLVDKSGGIFVRRSDQIAEEDKILMQTVARLIVSDSAGSLAEQMSRRLLVELPPRLLGIEGRRTTGPLAVVAAPTPPRFDRPDLTAFNGHGGFTRDGKEYVIVTTRQSPTPAPWVNVLANPFFGTVISESGGAYTWCENAHTYRLTPWHNDPVSDISGESFYIRDEADGRFFSPTPLPAGGALPYITRHGFGYSVFQYSEGGILSELHTYVATDAPLKFMVFKLRNASGRPRRLSLTALYELVLGSSRAGNLPHIVSEIDPSCGGLFARNAYVSEFASRVAFLDCSETQRTVSGDRIEVIGRNGTLTRPDCMMRVRLSGRVGAGLDPCLAMQVPCDLADGQEREIVFTFGSGRDHDEARTLVQRFRGTGPARTALEGVWNFWNRTLGAVNVQTPDTALNFLANGWLVYQVLSSRMWGRGGFYQSGGAFGFRDQLQDAMALVYTEPAILREHIVRAAGRQFHQGDVQHWWHPPTGRGVRTRIADDYLWLPYAVCRYVAAVGDTGILHEKIHFLEGRMVKAEEDSYYDLPLRSEDSASLYEHCVRAIKHGLRFGAHGLPLMGSGDWNDGMNLVGEHGQGESVWLAFFLYDVLLRFVVVARTCADAAFADECVHEAKRLRENIEAHGWDGDWYRRAYFDSGEPLGAATNPECSIDSLPQSWSVLSGAGDKERSRQALAALNQRLVRRDLGLIQLFDPPLDKSDLQPGYVRGYLPGVRENGGQYTHAAVWAVMAFAAAGDSERAWELFDLINPVHHGDSAGAIAIYKVEPYVVAADVYCSPQHSGRGGWTWYTGSAGWMYRLVVESLLGLRLEVDRLRVEPIIPTSWPSFDLHYRHYQTLYHIHIRNLGGGQNVKRVVCDGVEQSSMTIPLRDDQAEHRCEVEVGA